MAERRMFAKTIIDSDAFLDMPQSTQLLYFHLSMRADDDGFVNNPKNIMRMIGAKTDDLNVLFTKKFLLPFESGVVVIKHWRIHNYIQKDRYKQTKYKDEKNTLYLDENNAYTQDLNSARKTVDGEDILPLNEQCIQNVYKMDTQVRLGKDSIEIELDKNNIHEIVDYLNEICGTSYKATTPKTQSLIKARLKEGFTLDDFKTVIDKKSREWLGTDYAKYLRPETLFGTKFESYLNAVETHGQQAAPKAEKFDAMACLQELYEKHKEEEDDEDL